MNTHILDTLLQNSDEERGICGVATTGLSTLLALTMGRLVLRWLLTVLLGR